MQQLKELSISVLSVPSVVQSLLIEHLKLRLVLPGTLWQILWFTVQLPPFFHILSD